MMNAIPQKLTQHFTLDEMTVSETAARRGIDNSPPPSVVAALQSTAEGLEAVRAALGGIPLSITSGYRCPALNAAVGSRPNSQHTRGEAVDFIAPGFGSPAKVVAAIRKSGVEFDQLILEFDRWVHISFSNQPRHAVLQIDASGTRPLA